ncbi:MAG: hypothetical protein NUW37_02165 [Planctomycetes bacterium]|nr:hypothetical protein [Planctomycetota bacterium]
MPKKIILRSPEEFLALSRNAEPSDGTIVIDTPDFRRTLRSLDESALPVSLMDSTNERCVKLLEILAGELHEETPFSFSPPSPEKKQIDASVSNADVFEAFSKRVKELAGADYVSGSAVSLATEILNNCLRLSSDHLQKTKQKRLVHAGCATIENFLIAWVRDGLGTLTREHLAKVQKKLSLPPPFRPDSVARPGLGLAYAHYKSDGFAVSVKPGESSEFAFAFDLTRKEKRKWKLFLYRFSE